MRTGFKELDQLIGTLAPGSLNIIAARPAMGKTAFALTIAQHAALKEGVGVGIYSLEMPAAQLVLRMMCSEARIDMNRVRLGQLSDRDFSRLVDVAGRLSEAPIFIDDTPDLTLMELRARARRLRSQHNVGLIIIDYLQLMSGPGGGRRGEPAAGDRRHLQGAQGLGPGARRAGDRLKPALPGGGGAAQQAPHALRPQGVGLH